MGACGSKAKQSAAADAPPGPPRSKDGGGESGRQPREVDPTGPVLLAKRQFAASKQAQDDSELLVVIRVVKAELKRSCLKIGKMDPFAVVAWTDGEGCQWQGSRTHADYNGH